MRSSIVCGQASIEQLEARAADLEKYAGTLLEGAFREAVSSSEVLRFQVFIEDAFESCIGPNDANLDSFSMMKWIEKTHEELNLELDTLPPEVVQACEKEGFRQELKAIRETEEAAKKVRPRETLISITLSSRFSSYSALESRTLEDRGSRVHSVVERPSWREVIASQLRLAGTLYMLH